MKLFWKFMKLVKLIKRCVALVLLTALVLVLIPGSRHWLHENLVARRDGSAIKRYFNEALEHGDVDAALKYAKFYEERAKKNPSPPTPAPLRTPTRPWTLIWTFTF